MPRGKGETEMKTEILKATPNNLETFNCILLLAHELHEKDKTSEYYAKIDWKANCVRLIKESK